VSGKRNDTRNRLRTLFIVGNHAATQPQRGSGNIERIGFAFPPMLERIGDMVCPDCSCASRQSVSAAMSISSGQQNIRAIVANLHTPKQFRRAAQRLINAEGFHQAGNINPALPALFPRMSKVNGFLPAATDAIRGKVFSA